MEKLIASCDMAFVELTLFYISFESLWGIMIEDIFLFADKANRFVILAVFASEFNCDFREFVFWEIGFCKHLSGLFWEPIHVYPSSFSAESAFRMETSFAAPQTELATASFITAIT